MYCYFGISIKTDSRYVDTKILPSNYIDIVFKISVP